jgi:hypothetical protein
MQSLLLPALQGIRPARQSVRIARTLGRCRLQEEGSIAQLDLLRLLVHHHPPRFDLDRVALPPQPKRNCWLAPFRISAIISSQVTRKFSGRQDIRQAVRFKAAKLVTARLRSGAPGSLDQETEQQSASVPPQALKSPPGREFAYAPSVPEAETKIICCN